MPVLSSSFFFSSSPLFFNSFSLSSWIRVASEGRFTDVHGDMSSQDGSDLAQAVGAKIISANDLKKRRIHFSLKWSEKDDESMKDIREERLICEGRTLKCLIVLLAQGWLSGPLGADHNEAFLYKDETPL